MPSFPGSDSYGDLSYPPMPESYLKAASSTVRKHIHMESQKPGC